MVSIVYILLFLSISDHSVSGKRDDRDRTMRDKPVESQVHRAVPIMYLCPQSWGHSDLALLKRMREL